MNPPPLQFTEAFGNEVADKRLDILRRLRDAGSISEAARGAGVSYKAAWQAIEVLSNLAGAALVDKAVGGSGGGGARLTPAGEQLLDAAQLFAQARKNVFSLLEKRHGNALNLSSLAGLGLRTSMRNQLPCRIQSIETRASATWVQLELPNGALLLSKITQESAELLGLHVGMQALALCKASAVTVCAQADGLGEHNQLWGTLMGNSDAEPGTEVSARLTPGLQIVGFAGDGAVLRPGQTIVAWVDVASLVIALGE